MTELLVLGPIEIHAAGEQISLLQPRQHHVLAALLVDANRRVNWSTLVDRVWGAQPPETARTTLRAHVSRIRAVLTTAGELTGRPIGLVSEDGGYEVRADPDQIDLYRLRHLVRRARACHDGAGEERARLLREAVGLWRGDPLAGLAGEWAGRTRSAWQHERLDVVADWAAAELDLGHADPVVATLAELTEEHPLVESIAALYLRALHTAGRTAEAVQRYQRIRNRLAEELGVSPGGELAAAYKGVLGPAHLPARRSPGQLPMDVPGFVERRAHLDDLPGSPGPTPVALIRGGPGTGKTALAVHWAHRVAARFPDGQLSVDLRGYDPAGPPLDPAHAIRRCMESLGIPARAVPAGLEPATAMFRSELAGRRMLVLLDNARDVAQVRPLLPGTPGCLVLVTSRHQLTGLVVAEAARPLDLDVLTHDEAAQFLSRRLGAGRVAREGPAVAAIIERCARLPLALALAAARAGSRSSLAALAGELDRPGARLDVLSSDDPRTDLRTVFSCSYQALSAPAQQLFRLLGPHPGRRPPPGTRAPLAELTGASLLTEHPPGVYSCHDLLRAYAAELGG